MFSKANLIATVVGGILIFLLGYALFGVVLADYFAAHTLTNTAKETPNTLLIFVSNLIQAFALASIYGKWSSGIHNVSKGIAAGAMLGVFGGLGIGLLWFATSNLIYMSATLVQGVLDILFYGFIGMLVALVYKKVGA